MLEQPQYPIDDNTLFILLALRYQGEIEIDGLGSVYDYEVNYDETVINPSGKNLSLEELGARGIKWICENFKVDFDDAEKNTYKFKVESKDELAEFLDEYLSKFPHNKTYYYSEEKHAKNLYNFIKEKESCVLEHKDKYFTYKLLPKDDIEKYKMIEYIGKLLNDEYLISDNETFRFNNENGVRKKAIYLAFKSKQDIVELFFNFATEEDRKIMLKELELGNVKLSGEFFTLYEGNRIALNSRITDTVKLPRRYAKIFLYCLETDKEDFTADDYVKYHYKTYKEIVLPNNVSQYFPETNKKIRTGLDLKFDVIRSCGTKEWKIQLKP